MFSASLTGVLSAGQEWNTEHWGGAPAPVLLYRVSALHSETAQAESSH